MTAGGENLVIAMLEDESLTLNPMTGYFNEPVPVLRFYYNTGTPQTPLDAGGCESGVRSPRLAGARLFPNTERAPALAGNRLKKLPACSPPKCYG